MDSACVYEQKTVINELSQGIQMAKQLRVHLNSAEARQFLIQKILSSYENALFLLKSGDSVELPQPTTLPASSLAESSLFIGSGEFEFDQRFLNQQGQNVVSKKRKVSTTWKNQAISNKRKDKYNHGAQLTTPPPPPPPLPEKHDLKPTHHQQLSPPNSCEMLSNLSDNLSINTGSTVPSSYYFPLSPSGFMEEYYQQLHFPGHFDDELMQIYSPPFISPEISESNYFSEWGSSPSLYFSTEPADVNLDFKFENSLF